MHFSLLPPAPSPTRPLQTQGNHFDKYGGAANLGELNAVLRSSVMVRRLKKDVLTQLPRKRRQQVRCAGGQPLEGGGPGGIQYAAVPTRTLCWLQPWPPRLC